MNPIANSGSWFHISNFSKQSLFSQVKDKVDQDVESLDDAHNNARKRPHVDETDEEEEEKVDNNEVDGYSIFIPYNLDYHHIYKKKCSQHSNLS